MKENMCVTVAKISKQETEGKDADDVVHWKVLNWGVVFIFVIMRVFSVKCEGVKEGITRGRNFLGSCGGTLERDYLDQDIDCRDACEIESVGIGV